VTLFASLLAGLVFGLGLLVSGMANPAKVIGFLDLAGALDPSLAFVMVRCGCSESYDEGQQMARKPPRAHQ